MEAWGFCNFAATFLDDRIFWFVAMDKIIKAGAVARVGRKSEAPSDECCSLHSSSIKTHPFRQPGCVGFFLAASLYYLAVLLRLPIDSDKPDRPFLCLL